MAPPACLASRLCERLHAAEDAALSRAGLKLRFEAREAGRTLFEEYISDPAKPVPFRARPIRPIDYADPNLTWPQWLVDDQREASGRPDVVAFISDVLTAPVEDQRATDRELGCLDQRD